jgi:YVTN family beta-propeller protein
LKNGGQMSSRSFRSHRRKAVFLFLVLSLQLATTLSHGQSSRFRVLAFYSENTEPDHVDFAKDALKFLSQQAASEQFTLDTTTRWDDLNDERLKNCQLVIWLNESPSNAEQRRAFERYMEHGGAWLGFHAAAYNDKDTKWQWFVHFLGGAVFDTNSWPPLPARLSIDTPAHPVTAKVPSNFESPPNEWYVWNPSSRLNKDVQVLVTLNASNYPIGLKDVLTSGDLPVVWSNTKYKMLYMNMGHGDKIFTSPTQNQLIDNAVNWLGMGATPGKGTAAANGIRVNPNGIRINPSGIALNPQTGKFYAVNTTQNKVTVLDSDGRLLERIQVGEGPESIAINPVTNRVYVANGDSASVTVIDGTTDKAIANVSVGDLPYSIAVNQATNKVYVSRTFSDVTTVIDGKTNIANALKIGAGDAVAGTSLDESTYLINYESLQITALDGANDHASKIKATTHLWAIAANPANRKIYAASVGNATVTVIDGKSFASKVANVGEIPCAITVDSSSDKVFVANYGSDNVTIIDGTTDSVVATVNAGPNPQAITVDSGNHKVFIANTRAGTVTVLDGTNKTVVGSAKTSKAPFAIAVNSKTHKAVTLGLDGDLTVIDGTTLATSSPSNLQSK